MPNGVRHMQKFLLGVNYWPAKKGMFWWKDFEREEVQKDFERISSVGLEIVRLFLLWEDFEPSANKINQEAVANLIEVFRIAREEGLKILLTLFVGHMSGANWAPAWLAGRNIYQDEGILNASSFLAETIANSVKEEKALFGYDLANEIDNFVRPANRQEARKWLRFIVSRIKAVDSIHPVTLGLHLKNVEEDRGFWPEDLAGSCDFLSMHSYSIYAKWADNPLDGKVAAFTNRLITRMSGAKVMHTEFGLCTTTVQSREINTILDGRRGRCYLANEREAESYFDTSLRGLYESGALGAMLWCYSDYDPTIFNQPPFDKAVHERSFGLFRADGNPKPYKDIIKKYQGLEVKQIPVVKEIENPVYYQEPFKQLKEEYRKFREKEASLQI